jgi:pimeloyl-ACP methyl ester carboxylesterase
MFALRLRRIHSVLVPPLLLPFLLWFGSSDNSQSVSATDASYSVHGILNAHFPFSDPVFIVSWGQVSHGTLTVAARVNGFSQESFTYEPNNGYTGDDSFTYHACDSVPQCVDGTITLSVVNNAPHAVPDSYTLHGILQHGGDFPVTMNDSDPDHDPIRVMSVTPAAHGTFTYDFDHGSFTYEPRSGFAGNDSVSYTICDSLGLCDSTTITLIVVNHPPSANQDQFTIQNNETLFANAPAGGVLKNDSDADNDPFIVSSFTPSAHGHVISLLSDGSLIYEANQGFVGQDSFSYTVCDYLGACANGVVAIDVSGDEPTPTPTPVPTPVPSPTPPPPPSPTPTPTPAEPLIFIPGISGSKLNERLDDGSGFNLWPGVGSIIPPLIAKKDKLTLDPSEPQANIFVPDVIRTMPIKVLTKTIDEQLVYRPLLDMLNRSGYREYKVNNDPNRRTESGCDLSQKTDNLAANPNLFVFAYDWRKSNVENANLLAGYVKCVEDFYPSSKVNILTHSMGGMVARRYILDHVRDHNVNKLITIGAPWLGAPKAINALETGEFDVPQIVISSDLLKRLVEFFKSVHEIMPSRSYFALAGNAFGERNWDLNADRRLTPSYTYDQFVGSLDTDFARSKPGTANRVFHTRAQDNWQLDNTGVKYFHLYGVKFATDTIGKLTAISKPVCDVAGNCKPGFDFEKSYVKGDGTVPELSASRIAGSNNLNAPNVVPKVFRGNGKKAGHLELTQNPLVWADIIAALTSTDPSQATFRPRRFNGRAHHTRDRRAVEDASVPEEISDQPAYYVTISGVDQVIVTDADGNSNEPIVGSPFGDRLPDVTYDVGLNSVSIVASTDQPYSLKFQSKGEPVNIRVLKGVGTETPTESVTYLDLNLAAGTFGEIKLTPDGINNLEYDGDRDGTFESMIVPTATAVGASALDIEPPVIRFKEKFQSGSRLITITAADNQSGVKSIRYSLDGHKYQMYSGPFNVDACDVRTLYAFADDNGGNRSGLLAYNLEDLPPDVSHASPAFTTLWPPDHRMIDVPLLGVSDPECDPVTITITRITQDEASDGEVDGSTCPDAVGVGTSRLQLRAEREAAGNGRVYTIYFTASDNAGGSSRGVVKVNVPRSLHHPAVEDIFAFDSTTCARCRGRDQDR